MHTMELRKIYQGPFSFYIFHYVGLWPHYCLCERKGGVGARAYNKRIIVKMSKMATNDALPSHGVKPS